MERIFFHPAARHRGIEEAQIEERIVADQNGARAAGVFQFVLYRLEQLGQGRLFGQGVAKRMMGIDAFGFDRPFDVMAEEFRKGNREALFPAHHVAGRQKEYCHMEQLSNLDKIPRPFGFKVVCFPINITRASGGWVRPVAIIEE